MADGEKKEEMKFISKEEMLRLLLIEDETFKDEGRDVYMDEVIELMRKDLGTEDVEGGKKDPDA